MVALGQLVLPFFFLPFIFWSHILFSDFMILLCFVAVKGLPLLGCIDSFCTGGRTEQYCAYNAIKESSHSDGVF